MGRAWTIYDRRTGRRATVAAFLRKHRAQAQLDFWRKRALKGGRPDLPIEHFDHLYVGRVRRG